MSTIEVTSLHFDLGLLCFQMSHNVLIICITQLANLFLQFVSPLPIMCVLTQVFQFFISVQPFRSTANHLFES